MRIPALAWTQCEVLVSKSENTGCPPGLARAKILHDTAKKLKPLGSTFSWSVVTGLGVTRSRRQVGLHFRKNGQRNVFGNGVLCQKSGPCKSRPAWSFEQQREGLWACHDKLDASKFVFSTDASGGPDSADARLRVVSFALLAFTKDNDALTCVASITGFLPVGSSVAEGETRALFLLADSVEGLADVTCDCQSAIKKTQHLINLDCHWVRSHLSPEAFKKEFGEQQLWRMKANQLADTKCGKAAASLVDVSFRNNVLELDRVAQQVSAFLAERVELLLTSTKDPPPLVFEEKRGVARKDASRVSTSQEAKPHRAASQAVRCPSQGKAGLGKEQFSPPGVMSNKAFVKEAKGAVFQKLNKKQRLQKLLNEQDPAMGHQWQATSTKAQATNFAIQCQRCSLYIEQCNSQDIFDRKANHPCQDVVAPMPSCWDIHVSHVMVNKGSFFACSKCLASVKLAAMTTWKALQIPCQGIARKNVKGLKLVAHAKVESKQNLSIAQSLLQGTQGTGQKRISNTETPPQAAPKAKSAAACKPKPKARPPDPKQKLLSFS